MIEEARRQVSENGYAATTIRSIAHACGIGVGTMYNYFPSKDMLLASFMLEDWMNTLDAMNARIAGAATTRQIFLAVHECLSAYVAEHNALFSDPDALVAYVTTLHKHHSQMRGQIATLLAAYLPDALTEEPFTAQYLAESLLSWTIEGEQFDAIYSVIQKIISEGEIV